MSKKIYKYEIKSLRNNEETLKESYRLFSDHIMSLPIEYDKDNWKKLSEALAGIYITFTMLEINLNMLENREEI
jgi:hypothetical protein